MKRITMDDIAKELGVTKVTVSKALNDKEGVSEELKEKIKIIAKEKGYLLNAGAKALRTNRKNMVGILVPEVFLEKDENFFTRLYKNIYSVLIQKNYLTILNVVYKEEEADFSYPKVCQHQLIDGIIVLGQLNQRYLNNLKKLNIPTILVDFYYKDLDLDYVVTDNLFGMFEATLYLIERGHREIGFIGNVNSTNSIQDRFLGYCKALLSNDLPIKDQYVVKDRDENGEEIELLLPEKLPTAFVCNSDKAAQRLIETLHNKKCNVPEDVSVIGFDDVLHSTISKPRITTVRVNRQEMAKCAAEALITNIEKTEMIPRKKIVVSTYLVERESVLEIRQ